MVPSPERGAEACSKGDSWSRYQQHVPKERFGSPIAYLPAVVKTHSRLQLRHVVPSPECGAAACRESDRWSWYQEQLLLERVGSPITQPSRFVTTVCRRRAAPMRRGRASRSTEAVRHFSESCLGIWILEGLISPLCKSRMQCIARVCLLATKRCQMEASPTGQCAAPRVFIAP